MLKFLTSFHNTIRITFLDMDFSVVKPSTPNNATQQPASQQIDNQIRVLFDNLQANPQSITALEHENPELAALAKAKDFG